MKSPITKLYVFTPLLLIGFPIKYHTIITYMSYNVECYTLQSTSMPFNPYVWDSSGSSNRIGSDVIGLDFKDSYGNPIDTSNFTSDIEIGIPRKPREGPKNLTKFFLNPTSNDTLITHKFLVKYDNSAFHLRIKPSQEKKLVYYIRYGQRPTLEEHDYRRIVPDFRSCITPQACEMVREFMACMNYVPPPPCTANSTSNANSTSSANITCTPNPTSNANLTHTANSTSNANITPINSTGNNQSYSNVESNFESTPQDDCSQIPSRSFLANNASKGNIPPCTKFLEYIRCREPKCPDDNTTRCRVANCSAFNCTKGMTQMKTLRL